MFTVIIEWLQGAELLSESVIVLASDECDAETLALEGFEQDHSADYVVARVV